MRPWFRIQVRFGLIVLLVATLAVAQLLRPTWRGRSALALTATVTATIPAYSSRPNTFVTSGNQVFFLATTAAGQSLWRTDGTAAGTVEVRDLAQSSGATEYAELTDIGGTLFFRGTTTEGGAELWKSDGTHAGTVQVADIVPGAGSATPMYLENVGGTLFFRVFNGTTQALWKSDGTAAGTVQVKALSGIEELYSFGGAVYFRGNDGSNGYELWRSDGTEAGTTLVRDIYPGPYSSGPKYLTAFAGKLYFAALGGMGMELFSSDGTYAGTALVKEINPSITNTAGPTDLVVAGNTLFFVANDGTTGRELWRSDGTAAGTTLVKNLNPDAPPPQPTNTPNPNTPSTTPTGTPTRTPTIWGYTPPPPVEPRSLTAAGNLLFFVNGSYASGQLWRSDGSEAGTTSLATYGWPLLGAGATLYYFNFGATELWKSDGTAAGSVSIGRIDYSMASNRPPLPQPALLSGQLILQGNDGTTGYELWRSDGTAAGTGLLKDLYTSGTTVSPTYTPTRTATACAQPVPRPIYVDPVISPTDAMTQTLRIDAGHVNKLVVSSQAGSVTYTGPSFSPALVTIPLLANTTHNIRIEATVPPWSGGGCNYAGYTMSVSTDRYGAPLSITQQSAPNLLKNPGMELDDNGDGDPDGWTVHANVTRSNTYRQQGLYSMRHQSTANNSYVIAQNVPDLAGGQKYSFSAWTNIPATTDTFTYKLEIVWRNGTSAIGTTVLKSYTASTGRWIEARGTFIAPARTNNAMIRMNVSSLNATIYADNIGFRKASTTPPPTPPTYTPTNTPTPTGTVETNTPTHTATRTPTRTGTPLTYYATVSASSGAVATGQPITVKASSNLGIPGYTLRVIDLATGLEQDQANPIFNPARPAAITGGAQVSWTLTAVRPGNVRFDVSVYGEVHDTSCGCWYFTTRGASSQSVVVSDTPAANLKVQYRAGDTAASLNQLKPSFNVVNVGTSPIPLSELKLRYYYTWDGSTQTQQYWCDWAQLGCGNISGSLIALSPAGPGADYALELSFGSGGGSLAAGAATGEIQSRVAKSDWSGYTQTGDYSFDATKTAFADWDRVTLYRNGTRVWGTEP